MSSRQALAVLTVCSVLGLSACSGDEESPDTDGAASSSEPSTTGTTEEGTTEEGVTTEDGDSVVTTYQGVPPGYPADDVPLLDPDEASGSVTEYDELTAYAVVVESDAGLRDTLEEAVALLAESGLEGQTEVPEGNPPAPVVLRQESPEIVVVLSGVAVGGGSLLTYSVEVS